MIFQNRISQKSESVLAVTGQGGFMMSGMMMSMMMQNDHNARMWQPEP